MFGKKVGFVKLKSEVYDRHLDGGLVVSVRISLSQHGNMGIDSGRTGV